MSIPAVLGLLRSPDLSPATKLRFNTIVRDSLQPVSIGLAVLYAFFAATHAAVLPEPNATILASVAAGVAVCYFLLSVMLRAAPVQPNRAHPLATVIIGLALIHGFLQLYLLADPQQTTNVTLIILGASLLLLSVRWLALVILVSLIGWVAIAWQSSPSPSWLHFAFELSAVSALGITINAVRYGMHQRLEDLRRQDAIRTRQLEATMQVALESEGRFRTVIQTAGSAMVVLAADYRTLEFNAAAEALYGRRRDAVIGQDFRQLLGPTPSADPFVAHLDTVLAGAAARGIESVVHSQDGRQRTVLWNLTRFVDGAGEPAGVVAIGQDITARKRNEEAQRFLAEVSRVLVSSLDDTALVHTVARLAVPELADWCSVSLFAADTETKDSTAVAHIDPVKEVLLRELYQRYRPAEAELINTVRQTSQTQVFPICSEALLDGLIAGQQERQMLREVGCSSTIIAPLIARGITRGVLVFALTGAKRSYGADDIELINDLAGRIALAIDNARLYRDAQAALRMRDEFLSVAAHELKTPLVALVGATQLFDGSQESGSLNTEVAQRQLYVICKATQRLHKLIDSLIELTHIQAGTSSLRRKPLDLRGLAQRTVEAVQPAPRHRIELYWPDTPVMLLGDEARLELALYNLVQNAIKYSPKGGMVTVRVGQDDANVWVSVRDEGIGIPLEAQAHLFERFYRANNVNPEQIGGMGIGLHLVQEIVIRHGGTVEVESVEGEGSTFTVCLPRNELPRKEATRLAEIKEMRGNGDQPVVERAEQIPTS